MNLTTTRALVRTLPLDTSTRGEWLAWCVAVDRGYVPAERAAAELVTWRRRLGLERSSVVGDAATDPSDPRAIARNGKRSAEQWLEQWSEWMSASQEAQFHRQVVMQLEVASQVSDPTRSRELALAAVRAWNELAHAVIRNVRAPTTLLQQQTMEQATHIFNGAVPVLQAGLDAVRSGLPWLAIVLGVAAVGTALVLPRLTMGRPSG